MTLSFSRKKKTIEVDGQQVHLSEPSEAGIQKYANSFHDLKGKPIKSKMMDARVALLQLCIVDESGEKMYDAEGYAAELREWPASVTKRLFDECRSLCGLDDEQEEGDVEKK